MKKIELLAPAGSLDKLKFAYLYGADACYIGGVDYSLRANAKNFTIEEIKEACNYAHKLSKKVYVTVNIVFHNEDTKNLVNYLKELEKIKVDAIIVSDMLVIDLVKKHNIKLDIHISTQDSISNSMAINFLKDNGVKRVVLARECCRDDIKSIIDKTGMEVEVFLHGAMCSAYSGRCVLSNYKTLRDANRGGCAQICRFNFSLYDKDNNLVSNGNNFTLAAKDLIMLDNLEELIKIGVTSLKVEGRMRSSYYVATVISTYREAIDNYYNNTLTKEKLDYYKKILSRVANRDNVSQFFDSAFSSDYQYYLGRQEESNQDFLGMVKSYDKEKKEVTLLVKNNFKVGTTVEFFGPNITTFSCTISNLQDEEGNVIEVANHPEVIVKFKLERPVFENDIMRIKI